MNFQKKRSLEDGVENSKKKIKSDQIIIYFRYNPASINSHLIGPAFFLDEMIHISEEDWYLNCPSDPEDTKETIEERRPINKTLREWLSLLKEQEFVEESSNTYDIQEWLMMYLLRNRYYDKETKELITYFHKICDEEPENNFYCLEV